MKTICSETLLKYAVLLTKEVEMDIAVILPASFGVMLDGWSFQSEHFVAVFAVFEYDQRSEMVLLALAPIVDEEVEDQSAESHVSFFRGSIHPMCKPPFNFAVTLYLLDDEPLLEQLQQLMRK
ncbi:hypothetical protein L915_08437 [Phytophthora nicotianae]|uniref:Uncharacterized protein n=1 Tax=Phytophthora nicotianae TaxID=4792 RepID=W2J232_PHYNI|nr:hypothetical protein L915_08437 [Phytophthora nicotianae]ETL40455.1 hypothetical protein L916_08363 [Phytophthora nicotianae]